MIIQITRCALIPSLKLSFRRHASLIITCRTIKSRARLFRHSDRFIEPDVYYTFFAYRLPRRFPVSAFGSTADNAKLI
ncbi:hypothetical protein PUN28_011379 [Cardiocondyla obscurior]|uniref:Uncharacterized protein n=1 Tax=Cardiocondyla obscurior TaxID=286306 RepID=A0AAW2FFJ9_9HYME